VTPTGTDDADVTTPSTAVVTNVLTNDAAGPSVDVSAVTQGANGTVTIVDAATGTVSYTPDDGFAGIDSYTYTACVPPLPQADAALCFTRTVTIKVGLLGADDSDTTPHDTLVTTNLLTNDPSGPSVDVAAITQGANGTVSIVDAVVGTVSYTPDAGFAGIDSYTYTACVPPLPQADATLCVTQDVTVKVTPGGSDDTQSTTTNTPVTSNVLTNDTSVVSLDVTVVTDGTNGTVTIVNAATGTVRYNPAAGFSGIDSYVYTACVPPLPQGDATLCITQNVVVTIRPTGLDDSATTALNTAVDIALLDNDPSKPSLSLTTVTDAPNGTVTINLDGTVKYTPDTGFSGVDTFTYTACDAADQCITQTVTVTVLPAGADDGATTSTNSPVTIRVLANDGATGLIVESLTDPPHGAAVINADGSVTYTPDTGYSGSDTFQYTACDSIDQCITKTVAVFVTPLGVDDTATTPVGTPVKVSVRSNDPSGPSLTIGSTSVPANGTVVINADGTVTYTPSGTFSGIDTFTYTACDAADQCVTQTVTVTVTPVGTDDAIIAQPGKPVIITVLGNDASAPSLVVVSVSPPAHGTAVIGPDGTISYVPNVGFSGVDAFTYTACDAANQCITQTVRVTVSALPATGSDAMDRLVLAAVLVVTGCLLVFGRRRRSNRATAGA
jgi:hypothetical protein